MKRNAKLLTTAGAAVLTLTTLTSTAMASTNNNQSMVKPSPVTANAATNLRVTLDNLLGEHAVLAILAMEKGYDNAPDYTAVASELNQNTKDLTNAIASVYGTQAGDAFNKMWSAHIGFFVDYVTATAKGDSAGQQAALNNLEQYKQQFSQFLASANPNLNATTLAAGLQVHVNELITTFTDYVNKDYAGAENEMVQAYSHMFMTGDALSAAMVKQFPQKFGNQSTATSAADLRVTLDKLLGLHADLALIAMQDGYTGAPDFSAVANVLNQNTTDLTGAITSVYGTEAGAAFNKIWSNHIGYFVDYVTATVKNDAAAKQTALDNLANYKTDFSNFLAQANPNLDATSLADGLQTHINQLIGSFNDYTNKDYTDAESQYVAAYNHMFMTGDGLSAAIVKQFPGKFESQNDTWTWTALALDVNNVPMKMPLGVWGVNPTTGQSEPYVPIWYVIQVLNHVGVTSMWNGMNWSVHTSGSVSSQPNFAGGTKSISINGQAQGMVNGMALVDPYSHKPTTFMAMSDVAKLLSGLGLKYSWGGSTLNIHS